MTRAEQEPLLDWLGNVLKDQLEFTEEFKVKIEQGERDIREGRVPVNKRFEQLIWITSHAIDIT